MDAIARTGLFRKGNAACAVVPECQPPSLSPLECSQGARRAASADDAKPAARSNEKVTVSEEARQIHRDAILIDGHNDLPWQYRKHGDLSFRTVDITKRQPNLRLHTDIPRLREGGVGAQFWAAYVT